MSHLSCRSEVSSVQLILALSLLVVLLASCAANHKVMSPAPVRNELIVSEMLHNDKGLPILGTVLHKRPSLPGEHFTMVQLADNRPLVSYDIALIKGGPDFNKPLEAIYKWSGKGFSLGLNVTGALIDGLHGNYAHGNGNDALAALVVVFAPVAIGSVTGFVIGVGDGAVQSMVELKKFALGSNEKILTCTLYDYDLHGRLFRMRMLTPDRSKELVRTIFEYSGNGPVPVRTVVDSFVEGMERDIR